MNFLQRYKSEIDSALREFLRQNKASEKVLHAALRHGVLLGGKRVRVILALLAFEVSRNSRTKVSRKQALRNLLSLELIHAFSLIHDDLPALDDDELRRGVPTVWKKFGEANAILAGDALIFLAFENLAKNSPPDLLARLIQILARGSAGMIAGQVRDLDAARADFLRALLKTHSQKTGELILASVRMGGVLANASSSMMKLLEQFATKLGLAFQIKDDLLDAMGEEKVLGKKVGKDLDRKGFVKILGIKKSQAKLEELIHESIQISRELKSEDLEKLSEFVLERKT